MVRVCFIGGSGHYKYAIDGIKGDKDAVIVGASPGSRNENMDRLYRSLSMDGHSPQIFDDYRLMLDKLRPDVAVLNCHFGDQAKAAMEVLKRGIHAFVEKPVATTFEDLEQLRNIYNQSDAYLAAMFNLRYSSAFLTAWQAVRDGAVGEIRLMNAQKSYKLGSRDDYYKDRKTYGGTIPWVGSHAIDWLYWFSGHRFKSVFASHSTMYNNEHGDLEVSALCHFIFDNDIFGSVNIDYLRPKEAPSHSDDRIRIAGTGGIIEVRDNNVFLINDQAQGIQQLSLLDSLSIFADFLKQVRGQGDCMVSAEDSFYVTEACLKARLSADENKVVNF